MIMNSKPARRVLFVVFDTFKTERLGVQILSALARNEGWERRLISLASATREKLIEEAASWKPDLVAYSAMTFEQYDLQAFNRRLKERLPDTVSIFGGPHYTFNPEEMERDEAIDIVCRGEGEIPFPILLRALREGADFRDLPKCWVRRSGEIFRNPVGEPVPDLDAIPFPDRELVPEEPGSRIFGNCLAVLFGRGCPNRCTYCFNARWNELHRGHRICRWRSAGNVLEELRELKEKRRPDFIYFHDDNMALIPRDVLAEFCRRYRAEIGIPFLAQFRAEMVTEDLVLEFKEAGMKVAAIGVECSDGAEAWSLLQRGKVTNEAVIKAFDIFNRHKILNFSQNMAAFPVRDPLKNDLETIKLNIRCRPTWASFTMLLPLPKTAIHEYAVKNGYLAADAFDNPERLPSVFTNTVLDYHDPALQRRVNNLHKLASVTVKFPFLLPLVKVLIRLPLTPLYQMLHFAWYGYWNSIGLFGSKPSPRLIFQGLKAIRQYRKKF